ncbi:hypothetical protein ACMA1D_10590 [Streptomyces sp. 796.1]|uniref:hypothetical protein n=1 Tax=Streptomyces sp. 796.1 TaxID=3163029 RepID=UPI0039C905C5
MDGHDEKRKPEVGKLAKDAAKGKIGVVRDTYGGRVQLQPLNGGQEWDAAPEKVTPLTPAEELSERNAARGQLTEFGAQMRAV